MNLHFKKINLFSILYLLVPSLLFLWFWFRWELAIPLVLGISYLAYQFYKSYSFVPNQLISKTEIGITFFLALFFTYISGTGAFAPQMPDHITHVTKVKELAENAWPVIYPKTGHFAKYYFGYSLVPALLTRFLGLGYDTSHFIFTVLGLWLGFIWLYKHLNKSYLGIFFVLYFMPNVFVFFRNTIETNLNGLFFGGLWPIIAQLFWNPNQTIPAILGACLLYENYQKNNLASFCFVPVAMLPMAVFPALYLAALWFFLLVFSIDVKHFWQSLKSWPWLSYAISIFVFISLGLYFSSGNSDLHQGFLLQMMQYKKLAYLKIIGVQLLLIMAIFVGIIALFNQSVFSTFKNKVLVISLLILFLFGNFILGLYNDLFMRGQMCLLIIPLIYVFNAWFYSQLKVLKWVFSLLILYVCYTNFEGDTTKAFSNNVITQKFDSTKKFHTFQAMENVEEVMLNVFQKEAINQYLCSEKSVYAQYLAPVRLREQAKLNLEKSNLK